MRCLEVAGSRKKPRHSLRFFGAPIPTKQQYHLQHLKSILFLGLRTAKVHQRPCLRQYGEHIPCSTEAPAIESLYHLNRVTGIFRNTNFLMADPFAFWQSLRSDCAQDQSGCGSRLRLWFRVALQIRAQILGEMVSWKFRLAGILLHSSITVVARMARWC